MPIDALPLNNIVQVNNYIQAAAVTAATYNVGLIVGPTRVVQPNGLPLTMGLYPSVQSIVQAGYPVNSPEVLAASQYFTQDNYPVPAAVYIGVQDSTAIQSATISAGGTGYVVGDHIAVSQAGAQGAAYTVSGVGANGVVTALQSISQGTGYVAAQGVATTGGTGTGLALNITAIGQTPVQALTAARVTSATWWGCCLAGNSVDADQIACTAWASSAQPDACFFPSGSTSADLQALPTSIEAQLMAAGYPNAVLNISTTQQNIYPNNLYASARIMGLAMGLNTGAPGCAFSLANKQISGIVPDALNAAQFSAIRQLNGNAVVYSNNNRLVLYSDGTTPAGLRYDQLLLGKMLAAQIRSAVASYILGLPKLPQSDVAQNGIYRTIDTVLNGFVTQGWIGPGTYTGPNITFSVNSSAGLTTGSPLTKGYYVQSDSYVNQLPADRVAGKAMPVTVVALSTGAAEAIVINNYIQL